MNSELREQISAFVDGELDSNEAELLVRRLGRDDELRGYAGTLMDVGRIMRGERLSADSGFVDRVRAGLVADDADRSARMAYSPQSHRSGTPPWMRAAGGLVLTLGVATLALNWMDGSFNEQPVLAEQSSEQALRNTASEPQVDYVVPAEVAPSRLVIADPELAGYVMNHSATRRTLVPGAAIPMLDASSVGQVLVESSEDSLEAEASEAVEQ
ncbi:MAG: sigma-E factor negative regulatory protein [Pseudomonadota bacterium]